MTAAPHRTRAKVGGGRATANRYANLAGDAGLDAPSVPLAADAGGLVAGLAAASVEQGRRIIQIPVAETAPHPYNDPTRSEPKPGEPKWEELVNGVLASGVQLPILAVTREAFLATRPVLDDRIPADARWVIIYGHRRRAAALAADIITIPAIVDDFVMQNDGDLDAMANENLGREDLSELAEAELFARYSDIGLSQRAIAERLGIDQATVSRRLALLLLAPRIQDAVAAGDFPSADAAALAGSLPYGPNRRWQKSPDPRQGSVTRREDQIAAYHLIVDRQMSGSSAAARISAERNAREAAAAQGVEIIVDPRERFGPTFYDHRVFEGDDYDHVVGAIDPGMGTLVLYALTPPERASRAASSDPVVGKSATEPLDTTARRPAVASSGVHLDDDDIDSLPSIDADKKGFATGFKARRRSCENLAAMVPSKTDLAAILIDQYVTGIADCGFSAQADSLVEKWGASASPRGDKARQAVAWMRAIAAGEMHTSALTSEWDPPAVAHMRLLIARANYQPARWEQARLDAATA